MRISITLENWFLRNNIGYDEIYESKCHGFFLRTKDKDKVIEHLQKNKTVIQCKEIDNNFVKVFYK
jgi:hypothetical protein